MWNLIRLKQKHSNISGFFSKLKFSFFDDKKQYVILLKSAFVFLFLFCIPSQISSISGRFCHVYIEFIRRVTCIKKEVIDQKAIVFLDENVFDLFLFHHCSTPCEMCLMENFLYFICIYMQKRLKKGKWSVRQKSEEKKTFSLYRIFMISSFDISSNYNSNHIKSAESNAFAILTWPMKRIVSNAYGMRTEELYVCTFQRTTWILIGL